MDPECKWLIYGAVEASVRALSQELADGGSRTARPLSAALTAFKNKGSSTPQKGPHGSEVDRLQAVTTKLDLLIASIVSKALVTGFAIDEQTVSFADSNTVKTSHFPLL